MKPLDARTSHAMQRVPTSRTAPEEEVAKTLRSLGIAYRRGMRNLPGRPDFSNKSKGWALFVHGCFWHQHDCKRGTLPANNREAWIAKFNRNRRRDEDVEKAIIALGLRPVIVWECETRDSSRLRDSLKHALREEAIVRD